MIGNFKRFISSRVKDSKFICIRCGNCCKYSEIILSNREIRAISTYLNISIDEFKTHFLTKKNLHKIRSIFSDRFEIKGEVFVLQKNHQNLCPFYQEIEQKATCKIYSHRPIVCRLYPFTWKTSPSNENEFSVAIDYSENGWTECAGLNDRTGDCWDIIRDEITGAVLLSIIQSNELISDGFLTQSPRS